MNDIEDLTPEEKKIRIAGRVFTLREMSCEDNLVKFARYLLDPTEKNVEKLSDNLKESTANNFGDATKIFMEGYQPLFIWLLKEDSDGQPVSAEWIAQNVSYKHRKRIIQIQEDLNGMAEIAGNAQNLLVKARSSQEAKKIVENVQKTLPKSLRPKKKKTMG